MDCRVGIGTERRVWDESRLFPRFGTLGLEHATDKKSMCRARCCGPLVTRKLPSDLSFLSNGYTHVHLLTRHYAISGVSGEAEGALKATVTLMVIVMGVTCWMLLPIIVPLKAWTSGKRNYGAL